MRIPYVKMGFTQHACIRLFSGAQIDMEDYRIPIAVTNRVEVFQALELFEVGKAIVVGYTETEEVKEIVSLLKKNAIFLSVPEATAIRSLSDVQHDKQCAQKMQTDHSGITVIVGEVQHYYVYTFRHLNEKNLDYTSKLVLKETWPDANFADKIVAYSTDQTIFVGAESFLDYARKTAKLDACDYVDHKNMWNFVRDGVFLKAQSLWPYSSMHTAPQPKFVDKTEEEE